MSKKKKAPPKRVWIWFNAINGCVHEQPVTTRADLAQLRAHLRRMQERHEVVFSDDYIAEYVLAEKKS